MLPQLPKEKLNSFSLSSRAKVDFFELCRLFSVVGSVKWHLDI